ncbi:hypothetical protein OROGR_003726 [Orobanche gracilis]
MPSMESDSDLDACYISATPRNSSPPSASDRIPMTRLGILLSSTKSRTKKTSVSTSTTSRTILQPKVSKKYSVPPSEPGVYESKPLNTSPVLFNLPFRIQELGIPHVNHGPDSLLHGGHCRSKFASFVKARDKNLDFEPDNPAEKKTRISVEESAGFGDALKDEGDGKGSMLKKVRTNLILIGAHNSNIPNVKRVKSVGEGNFVKLNINGYGRKKFKYKNKTTSYSSSYRRRKYSKGNKGGVRGGGEEIGVIDEEGLVVDIPKGPDKSSIHAEMIEEAVERVKNDVSDNNLLNLLKVTHGYDSFREGQLEVIKMVLLGKSTMLVLPTGAGKSLCYQLPAIVFPGVTLVVSPLVALMIDQLRQLPPVIQGGLLCSSQIPEEASETMQLLQEGAIKVLFVSPERFLNPEFISIFSGLSLLSLVVVDEAHCVSEWSHNFRPSYMRLRASLLRGRLNAGCILAMTATATNKTLCDVMQALEIPPANLVHSTKLRDNLHLSVSMSGNRTKDLLKLLKSTPFLDKSIIVYCKFQSETDMISKYLRDNNIYAKSYHSGIPAKDRSRIQDLFCSNRIRVVVATVAFGMGLNKSDVGAVIHYSLPESLEEYVQEIGRAGRDGRLSYCHLLFDDVTYIKLRSLMHSDGVDEYAVKKLLCQIFPTERPSTEETYSMIKELASRKFDMREEGDSNDTDTVRVGPCAVYTFASADERNLHFTIPSVTPPPSLAARDTVVAKILKKSEMKDGQYIFSLPSVANSIRMQAVDVSNHLQSLKLKGEITYELKDQAFCYTILEVPKDDCSLAAQLTKWLGEVETCKVRKLDAVNNAVTFAAKVCDNAFGCHKDQHTHCLQRTILEYFNRDGDCDVPIQMDRNSRFLQADIKVFLQSNAQMKFTPRAVARILHGLSSPAFPSATWSRTHFWGRYVHIDFSAVMEAAKQELINFVGKGVT